ncbi:MAG: hypothetical protein WC624_04980 [Candidatus Margulisiibacteriota bacterium]
MSFNVGAELPKEKLYAAQKLKQNQGQAEQQAQQNVQKQAPNMMNGVQWQAAQQSAQQVQGAKNANGSTATNNAPKSFEISLPEISDTAVLLSTSVSINEESVEAPTLTRNLLRAVNINMGALEETYRETLKKSRSHNMLLERFMSNVKMGGLSKLLSMCGMSAEKLDEIKSEVRKEALSEIDAKLVHWAYTKAMLEITGGVG